MSRIAGALLVFSLGILAAPAQAAVPSAPIRFEIASQSMTEALKVLADQADLQIMFMSDAVGHLKSPAVSGLMSAEEALKAMLAGSGLEYSRDGNVVVVRGKGERKVSQAVDIRMAQAQGESTSLQQVDTAAETAQPPRATQSSEQTNERQEQEVIVTGTNIRGIAPKSSPVRTFTREEIINSGVSTAQDFIALLPQNFGGGSNTDSVGLPNDSNSGYNAGGFGALGSSINLRGLGSGSTLVLLNGHRVAPSSGLGDFVDISMIPASALQRIEMLTDGAAAIYGGDAVAGVVNFILRDDFEGVETALRYGSATQGDYDEYRASLAGGKNWGSGHGLLVYEYLDQSALMASERPFSRNALPPNSLLPSQKRHSFIGSLSQQLSANLDMFGEVAFSRRDAVQNFTRVGSIARYTPSTDNLNLSAGGTWQFADSWYLDLSSTYSTVDIDTRDSGTFISHRTVASDIWTGDAKVSGSVWELPGGAVKLALGSHYRMEDFAARQPDTNVTDRKADRDVYAFFGEALIPIVGPGNAVRGIDRLELNISGRFEDYSDFGTTSNPKFGLLWSPMESLRVRASYSTSFKSPPLGRVGAFDKYLNAATTQYWNSLLGLTPADPSIANVVVLTVGGTDDNLQPETSRAFTAGFDFGHTLGAGRLAFNANYFEIDFRGRLDSTPMPNNQIFINAPNLAFSNPQLFPQGTVVFSPTQQQITALLASLDRPPVIVNGTNPQNAQIINNALVVRNIGRTVVNGIDFDIQYGFDTDAGAFTLGLDSSYLLHSQKQGSSTTPLVEQLNTLYNPVDLKLRGRFGYVHEGFGANLFVNYINDYHVDSTANAVPIDSWTTIDATLSYDFKRNTVVRLSAMNLLDQDPPSAPSDPNWLIYGFDPSNASPLGRFISVELSKRW